MLGVIILAVYGLSFWAPFFYDDLLMVVKNPDVIGPWLGWKHFLIRPYSFEENYEPISLLIHRGLFLIGGLQPALFRLSNIALHWADCVLVMLLIERLLGPESPSFWLAALFAVYPSHTENIAVATFKKHILVALWGLLLLFSQRPWSDDAPSWRRRAAGALFLALGLMSKENAAILPAILIAVSLALAPDWKSRARRESWFFGALFAIDLVFLYWRSRIVPRSVAYFVGGSLSSHLLTAAKCLAWYLREFFVPIRLCQEHSISPLQPAWSWTLAKVAGVLSFAAALAAWLWRKDKTAFVGLAIAVLWLVPFLNLIPYLNLSLVANRYIYLSMAGVLICAGSLSRPLWKLRLGRLQAVPLACAALGLVYAGLAMNNLSRYSDPVEVWERAVCCAPDNPRAHFALAVLYANRGMTDAADREFRAAARGGEPTFAADSAVSLAMLYAQTGRLAQAGHIYRALGVRYIEPGEFSALGTTLMMQGRTDAAIIWFKRALSANPRDSIARFKLASCYDAKKNRREAKIQWKSLADDPLLSPGLALPSRANLGLIYLREKRRDRARAAFESALAANPNDVDATTILAGIYAKDGRPDKGLALFDALVSRLQKGERIALRSADEMTDGELRKADNALPLAVRQRALFRAENPRLKADEPL